MARKNVLVFSGKDQKFTGDILRFLHKIGLHPVEPPERFLSSTSDPDQLLQAAIKAACAIVILLTGDDEAHIKRQWYNPDDDKEDELYPLPQPGLNILFATGVALAISSDRTILVKRGQLRLCKYFINLHCIELNDSYEKRSTFIEMLRSVHCEVNLSNNEWIDVGDFSDPD